MNSAIVILRKICDDPSSRLRAKALLSPKDHFPNRYQAYLFLRLTTSKEFESIKIISSEVLLSFIQASTLKEIQKKSLCNEVGAIFYGKTPSNDNFEYALKTIAQEAEEGFLTLALQSAARKANANDFRAVKEIIANIPQEAAKFSIASERTVSARSLANFQNGTSIHSFPTGFKIIDSITGGGRLGELWLWAGYISEYKSTCLIAIAHYLMLRGLNVLYVSLEMTEEEIKERLICTHAYYLNRPIPFERVHNKQLLKTDNSILHDYASNSNYGQLQIFQPTLGADIMEVQREIEAWNSRDSYPIVIIDYLQLLEPTNRRKDHRIELNEILKKAKRIAMEARARQGVWLISGHQISSDGRKRAEEKEGKYDLWALSETIGAGQIANVVCWSYATDRMKLDREMKVGLAKSRNSSIQDSIHFLPVDLSVGFIGREPIQSRDETTDVSDLEELE